jgi:sulfur carrier protein
MSAPFTIQLNGQLRGLESLTASATVADVVSALGLRTDRLARELNGGIVARRLWSQTSVHEGDRVEIVHFVGGGCSRHEDEACAASIAAASIAVAALPAGSA